MNTQEQDSNKTWVSTPQGSANPESDMTDVFQDSGANQVKLELRLMKRLHGIITILNQIPVIKGKIYPNSKQSCI
ncbi:hypothetical protein [Candidatus Nitrosocosmicus sp. T]